MSTVATHPAVVAGPWDYSRPARRLERLLRRNAVVVQAVFALLWAIRLAVIAGPWEVPALVALVGAVCVRRSFRATAGLRARDEFRTPRGRAFLRPVTRLTAWQVAASIVLPALAAVLGAPALGVPLVALSITVFLVGFGPQLQIGAVRVVGVLSTVVCLVLPLAARGEALTAWVSLVMVIALIASVVACARSTS